MRRAQSVRTYHTGRASLGNLSSSSAAAAADPQISVDLSTLRESDEQTSTTTTTTTTQALLSSSVGTAAGVAAAAAAAEETLRKQLLEKDRENDKLHTTILSLQTQLASRPPIETILSLEKEYKNLDLILQGTQRENERCMAELERVRLRERALEQALQKLAGEHWQTVLDIGPPSAAVVARAMGTSLLNRGMPAPVGQASDSTAATTPAAAPSQVSIEATLSEMQQFRLLVLGMEQRMEEREQMLTRTIERAETQKEKCEALRKDAMPAKVAA